MVDYWWIMHKTFHYNVVSRVVTVDTFESRKRNKHHLLTTVNIYVWAIPARREWQHGTVIVRDLKAGAVYVDEFWLYCSFYYAYWIIYHCSLKYTSTLCLTDVVLLYIFKKNGTLWKTPNGFIKYIQWSVTLYLDNRRFLCNLFYLSKFSYLIFKMLRYCCLLFGVVNILLFTTSLNVSVISIVCA